MKIKNIDITNALGCRRFSAELKAPVCLIAGKNGAGKTSIIESVRFALTGDMPRVSLKKDATALVSDGAKIGSIAVSWDGDEAIVALPECKLARGQAGDIHAAMKFVCDMQRFAASDANERRTFLFGITGTSASTEEVRKRLLNRGADAKRIEAALPLLRSGFPAAHDEAKAKARDAKAQWKAITGETYGDKKAALWNAGPVHPIDRETEARCTNELAALEGDLQEASRKIGELQSQANAAADRARKGAELREKAEKIPRITDKLERDRAELAQWEEKTAATKKAMHGITGSSTACACPECGAELIFAQGKLSPHGDLRGDPDAALKYHEYEASRALMASAVKNGERDLQTAREAAAVIASWQQPGESVDVSAEIDAKKMQFDEIKQNIEATRKKLNGMRDDRRKADEAEGKNKKAAEYHADVQAWDLIANALAPDGIPGELLAGAMKPVNALLAQSAADTGWMPVTIDAEMTIRAGGRPYALISESEKWRADAMLTAAIANLSGLKLALFDRFDVLDLPARSEALGWFSTMAGEGEVGTLIVAGTLKALPVGLPTDTFQSFWIENGEAA